MYTKIAIKNFREMHLRFPIKKGTKSSFYSINLNICNFDAIAWYYTFTTSSTSKVIFLVQMEKESRENRIFVF